MVGDGFHTDGRKRRIEEGALRKSVLGKKHNRLDESKVRTKKYMPAHTLRTLLIDDHVRRMTLSDGFDTYWALPTYFATSLTRVQIQESGK